MCGIAGFLQIGPLNADVSRAELGRMASAIAHRGPDDEGCWVAPEQGVALCHRRLSIVDLSPLGHQPMRSASGRYTVTFNGEIYNHRELRTELVRLGHAFRGESDTEVLLAAVEQWGLESTLQRSRGMFALGLWDESLRILHLARDRFGEKPLYYGVVRDCLLFGSELKALRRHRAFRAEVDRDALTQLLRYGFIPAPRTIFREVRKVRPGCIVRVRNENGRLAVWERRYWEPSASPAESAVAPGDDAERIEAVHEALQEAIRLQMVADVPVGAFLSGGIDSSLVVALMQRASGRPVRTFSIGFDEKRYDEAPYARSIARHLGTDHTELEVTAEDSLRVVPELPRIYDEPFADASQIPTLLVARLARRRVTVALSGDAGDELFGGYDRYADTRARWQHLQRIPEAVRAAGGEVLPRLARQFLSSASRHWRDSRTADRVLERTGHWTARSLADLYDSQTAIWHAPDLVVIGGEEPRMEWHRPGLEDLAYMMYVDTRRYLPDDILVKVDRAAMAVALETRVPFLDVRVAEAAWRIPTAMHTRDGRGKWVLRQLLARYVPHELFDRPKMGFAVPLGAWLRTRLRDWAEDLLDGARLRREGYFDASLVERRWHQHLMGTADWSFQLWTVLAFQAWLAESGSDVAQAADTSPAREPADEAVLAPAG